MGILVIAIITVVVIIAIILIIEVVNAPTIESDGMDLSNKDLDAAIKRSQEVSNQYRIFKNGGKLN